MAANEVVNKEVDEEEDKGVDEEVDEAAEMAMALKKIAQQQKFDMSMSKAMDHQAVSNQKSLARAKENAALLASAKERRNAASKVR